MNLHEIVSDLILDTTATSLGLFYPELILSATIVLMLLVRVFDVKDRVNVFYLALAGVLFALVVSQPWDLLATDAAIQRVEIFTGMLVYDGFTVFIRALLLSFLVLFLVMTRLTGLPDREDGPDIYTLVLGSTVGMMLMASSNHLLMVFLALEMASVPSYVLVGMLKGRKEASEAALKYSVYGAGAAGVMLYGISLVAGVVNTVHLPTIARELSVRLPEMVGEAQMALALGGLLIGVGLAFKLSAVPFHFWCPDVFEGATSEVNAFLSVASKAAALALLVRVALGFGTLAHEDAGAERPVVAISEQASPAGFVSLAESGSAGGEAAVMTAFEQTPAPGMSAVAGDGLGPVREFAARLIAFIAVLTCTFGNLAAYGQHNIKRLLAYSTIAHAGYMMMAVPPVLALVAVDPAAAQFGVAALAIYMFVYLFMNLGVFAVAAFLRDATLSEEIADYGGLIRRAPVLVVCFAIMLFSLIGLPPLAGFIGKLAVFASLASGYRETAQPYLLIVLVAGGINTAISLIYYMRVVKVMTMDPEPATRPPFAIGFLPVAFVVLITLPIVGTIITWDVVQRLAMAAAAQLWS